LKINFKSFIVFQGQSVYGDGLCLESIGRISPENNLIVMTKEKEIQLCPFYMYMILTKWLITFPPDNVVKPNLNNYNISICFVLEQFIEKRDTLFIINPRVKYIEKYKIKTLNCVSSILKTLDFQYPKYNVRKILHWIIF
jgi:hypothetical protein